MRLVMDGFPLTVRGAGISRYTSELAYQYARSPEPTELYLANRGVSLRRCRVPAPADRGAFAGWLRRGWLNAAAFCALPGRLRHPIVAGQTDRLRADVYFAPNYFGVYGASFRTVLAVHDLGYHLFPDCTQPQMLRALRADLPRHLERADGIVTDAESTRRDLVAILGVPADKVTVIPLAASPGFRPPADRLAPLAVRARYGLPERFVLFVGTVEPRKNLMRLFAAIERLAGGPGGRPLVVVGARGWKSEALTARLGELVGRGLAVHLGYVPDDDLAAIYHLADAFVFPSLYEGFGIPVLEAMACRVPVVCSSSSSLPEVAGDAAVYVDPMSEDELGEAIRRVVTDEELAAGLRDRGARQAARFSWQKSAEALLRYFESVLQRR